MAAIACSTRCGSPALGLKHWLNLCAELFFAPRVASSKFGRECTLQYLVIPMCSFASNVIGSHPAPLRATLLHFFSKNIFRTMFFCMRSQKGTFKPFPTKWYTLSLFQSTRRCVTSFLVTFRRSSFYFLRCGGLERNLSGMLQNLTLSPRPPRAELLFNDGPEA